MEKRIAKLVAQLPADFQAGLITSPENRFYFLGFHSTAGTLIVTPDKQYFIIDSRYIEAAGRAITGVEVILQDKLNDQVRDLLTKHGVKEVYLESVNSIGFMQSMKDALPGVEINIGGELTRCINRVRSIKDADEIAVMKKAQTITDACFTHILNYLKPGAREIDLALEMEFFMRKNGSEGVAFDTILVSGAKSSMPHGVPGDKLLEDGDFVTMDFGAKVGGYCNDMTRTVAIGHVTDEMNTLYATVLKAQLASEAAVRAGAVCGAVDKIARDIIYGAGYEGCFGHGLGHAVGVEIHEDPRFSPGQSTVLEPGMIMTVEPGIYLAGKFGARIEDTVCVTENGCDIFAKSNKELIIL